jgi:hypothetical protein
VLNRLLSFLVPFFFIFHCLDTPGKNHRIPLRWEYSVSKKNDSILQSLEKDFRTVSKDLLSPSLQSFPEKKGYLWLKAKFLIPGETPKVNLLILIQKFQWEKEVYLNGNLIHRDIEYDSLHWNHRGKSELTTVPSVYLNYDLENTILVKLYFEREIHFPSELVVGMEEDLSNLYFYSSLMERYVPIGLAVLFFLMALFHLRLFFLRNKDLEHFYIFLSLFFFSISSIYLWGQLGIFFGYSVNYALINKMEFLFFYYAIFFIYKIVYLKTKISISISENIIIEIYTIASTILFLLSGYGIENLVPYSIKNLLPLPIILTFVAKIFRGTSQKIKFCQYLYPFSYLILLSLIDDLYTLFIKNSELNYAYYSLSGFIFIISIYKLLETHTKLNKAENKIVYLETNLKEKINLSFSLQQEIDASYQSLNAELYIASLLSEPIVKMSDYSDNFQTNVFIEQKKSFLFKSKLISLGGDLCITKRLFFSNENKEYFFYCNGDATGKSLKGSIGALTAFIFFQSEFSKPIEKNPEIYLTELLQNLNQLFKIFSGNMYLSLSAGLISEDSGELYYSIAGHPKNILFSEGKVDYLPESQENFIGDFSEPIKIFKYSFQLNEILYISSDGRETLELGGIYGGAVSETEKLFLKVIEKSGGDFEFLIQEIKNYGKFSDDFSVIQIKCLNLTSSRRDLFFKDSFENRIKADNYFETKNFNSALDIYVELSKFNNDPDLQSKIGICHKNLKSYDKAIEYLLKSFKGNDSNLHTFLQLCDTYRLGGYYESAKELFLTSEKKFPQITQILKLNSLLKD